jgi:hypothetical protein
MSGILHGVYAHAVTAVVSPVLEQTHVVFATEPQYCGI